MRNFEAHINSPKPLFKIAQRALQVLYFRKQSQKIFIQE